MNDANYIYLDAIKNEKTHQLIIDVEPKYDKRVKQILFYNYITDKIDSIHDCQNFEHTGQTLFDNICNKDYILTYSNQNKQLTTLEYDDYYKEYCIVSNCTFNQENSFFQLFQIGEELLVSDYDHHALKRLVHDEIGLQYATLPIDSSIKVKLLWQGKHCIYTLDEHFYIIELSLNADKQLIAKKIIQLPTNTFLNTLDIDADGNYWVGTEIGLFKYYNTKYVNAIDLGKYNNLKDNIWSVVQMQNKKVLLSHFTKGLFTVNEAGSIDSISISKTLHPPDLGINYYMGASVDAQGNTYIPTNTQVLQYDGKNVKKIATSYENQFFSYCDTQHHKQLFCSVDCYVKDDHSDALQKISKTLLDNNRAILCVTVGRNGNYYFCSGGKLIEYNLTQGVQHTFSNYKNPIAKNQNFLPATGYISLHSDTAGMLWLGSKNGLIRIPYEQLQHPERYDTIGVLVGYRSSVAFIKPYKNTHLIIGYADNIGIVNVNVITPETGLPTLILDNNYGIQRAEIGQNGCAIVNDTLAWVLITGDLLQLNMPEICKKLAIDTFPNILLECNNKRTIQLQKKRENVVFLLDSFAHNFTNEQLNGYSVAINNQLINNNNYTYENLKAYYVKGINTITLKNSRGQEQTYQLQLKTKLNERVFYAVLLLIISSLVVAVWNKNKSLKQTKDKQAKAESEKELAVMRLNMTTASHNNHSLVHINLRIQAMIRELEKYVGKLEKFKSHRMKINESLSQLHNFYKNTFTNHLEIYSSLADEINLVNTYFAMCKIQLPAFEVKYNTHDVIVEKIQIPKSTLLTLAINSISYGIEYKKSGTIHISVTENPSDYLIEIWDNAASLNIEQNNQVKKGLGQGRKLVAQILQQYYIDFKNKSTSALLPLTAKGACGVHTGLRLSKNKKHHHQ